LCLPVAELLTLETFTTDKKRLLWDALNVLAKSLDAARGV